jgi:hypothetical protein
MSEDRAGRRERADTPRRRVRATHVLVRMVRMVRAMCAQRSCDFLICTRLPCILYVLGCLKTLYRPGLNSQLNLTQSYTDFFICVRSKANTLHSLQICGRTPDKVWTGADVNIFWHERKVVCIPFTTIALQCGNVSKYGLYFHSNLERLHSSACKSSCQAGAQYTAYPKELMITR